VLILKSQADGWPDKEDKSSTERDKFMIVKRPSENIACSATWWQTLHTGASSSSAAVKILPEPASYRGGQECGGWLMEELIGSCKEFGISAHQRRCNETQ